MRLLASPLWLALLSAATGCSQAAVSVRPFYTDDESRAPTVEPRIEGEWFTLSQDEKTHRDTVAMRWSIAAKNSGQYRVEIRVESEETGLGLPEGTSAYQARLIPIDDMMFVDVQFTEYSHGPFKVRTTSFPGLAPAHMVGRVWVQQDLVRVALLESEWVKDNSAERLREYVSSPRAGSQSIFVGSTQELRELAARNAKNPKAFAYVYYLCRTGSPDCVLRMFEDSLAHEPDDDEILEMGATFFLNRGNYVRAAALGRHRAELDPDAAERRADLGRLLLFNRDFDAARSEFAAAERLRRAYSFAPEGLVWSHYLEGNFAEAAKAAAAYKAADTERSANPILLGYLSLLHLGRQSEAESWLTRQAAAYVGSRADHVLLLTFQGRVKGAADDLASDSAAEWRGLLAGALANIGHGNMDTKAVESLKRAAGTKANDSLIALAARLELERIGAGLKP